MSETERRCRRCNRWRATTGRCQSCAVMHARQLARETEVGPGQRRCAHCSTVISIERSRCPECRDKRRESDLVRRRRLALERIPPHVQDDVLGELAAGRPLHEVCEEYEVTTQALHGLRVYYPNWGVALDAALMAGRDPDLAHGTPVAYRYGRCRCPECRQGRSRWDMWSERRRRRPEDARK